MKRLLLLLSCSSALLYGAELSGVQSVYLMPMSRGLDQYLANQLTNGGVFRVVTDPKLADAVFTSSIGEGLRLALEEFAPSEAAPPEPKPEEVEKKAGEEETAEEPAKEIAANKLSTVTSTFGRGKGTVFLVDAKSRQVLWSTFQAPGNSDAKQLDRTAMDIVSRLKRDLKRK